MKIEFGEERIILIPENEDDDKQLEKTLPDGTSRIFAYYTNDAGKKGNKFGLVITSKPKGAP